MGLLPCRKDVGLFMHRGFAADQLLYNTLYNTRFNNGYFCLPQNSINRFAEWQQCQFHQFEMLDSEWNTDNRDA